MNMSLSSLGGAIRHRGEAAVGPSSVGRVAPELEDGSLGAEGPFNYYKYPPSHGNSYHSMARGIHTRKRSRPWSGRARPVKRRRFARKGKRAGSITTRSTGASAVGQFRTKRTSAKAYRRRLWNATLDKNHYRTVYSISSNVASPATSNTATVALIQAMRPDANVFYQSAGGLNTDVLGSSAPTSFDSAVVIRGGIINMTVVNLTSSSAPLKVTIFLIKTGNNYDATSFPSAVQEMWDPSVFPGFANTIGKIIMKRTIMLENDGAVEQVYRLPVHKLFVDQWLSLRKTYVWCVMVNGPEAAADSVRLTFGFNMSFSADVIA